MLEAKTAERRKGTPIAPKPVAAEALLAPAPGEGGARPEDPNNFTPQARGRAREAGGKAGVGTDALQSRPRGRPRKDAEPISRRVIEVPTAALLEHQGNARTHSSAQITKLANSIREFGFTNPILTDGKLGVLAGHGRLMAARQLGLKKVPTIALALTAKQRRGEVRPGADRLR